MSRLAAWARAHDSTVEGLYSSPILPDAARHLEGIVDDLAKRYAIDGLHMDYLRYPTAEFDYSATALAAFRASVINDLTDLERARLDARQVREPLVYADTFPKRWADYRRARLSDLVARIRSSLKKQRPQALLSAAVKPDAARSRERSHAGLAGLGRARTARRDLSDGLHRQRDALQPDRHRRARAPPRRSRCGPASAPIVSTRRRPSRTSRRPAPPARAASRSFPTTA